MVDIVTLQQETAYEVYIRDTECPFTFAKWYPLYCAEQGLFYDGYLMNKDNQNEFCQESEG